MTNLTSDAGERAIIVLENLVADGKLDRSTVDAMMASALTEVERNAAFYLHLLYCANHKANCNYEKGCACEFGQEEIKDDCWSLPAHKWWLAKKREVLETFEITDTELIQRLNSLKGFFKEVEEEDGIKLALMRAYLDVRAITIFEITPGEEGEDKL